MKRILLHTIALLSLAGCIKPDCPFPTIPTGGGSGTTTKTSLQPGSEGIDANVSSYYPDILMPNGGKVLGFAWTFSGSNAIYRTYLNFDLSSVPAGKSVVSAKLYLYADTTEGWPVENPPTGHSTQGGSNDFSIYRVTSAWDESTITWNNQPTWDNVNMVSEPASTRYDEAYVIDLTQLIKDQITNPTKYYGFLLKLNDETTPYRRVSFYSSDNVYPTLRPKLEIEYK